MIFAVMPTPTYDDFETVTLSVTQSGVGHGFSLHKEVSPEEARAFAARIVQAAQIVEQEQAAAREAAR